MTPLHPFTGIASGCACALICFPQKSKTATVLSGQHVKCVFAACILVTRGSVAPTEHRRPFFKYNSYNRSRPVGYGQETNLEGGKARKGTNNTHYKIPTNPWEHDLFANVWKKVIQPKADTFGHWEHRISASKAYQLSTSHTIETIDHAFRKRTQN